MGHLSQSAYLIGSHSTCQIWAYYIATLLWKVFQVHNSPQLAALMPALMNYESLHAAFKNINSFSLKPELELM